jgi:hypothetical protein
LCPVVEHAFAQHAARRRRREQLRVGRDAGLQIIDVQMDMKRFMMDSFNSCSGMLPHPGKLHPGSSCR